MHKSENDILLLLLPWEWASQSADTAACSTLARVFTVVYVKSTITLVQG